MSHKYVVSAARAAHGCEDEALIPAQMNFPGAEVPSVFFETSSLRRLITQNCALLFGSHRDKFTMNVFATVNDAKTDWSTGKMYFKKVVILVSTGLHHRQARQLLEQP